MKIITVIIESSPYMVDAILEKVQPIVAAEGGIVKANYTSGWIEGVFQNKTMQNLDHKAYIEIEKIAKSHQMDLEYRIRQVSYLEYLKSSTKRYENEIYGTFSERADYKME